jgi:hypothetical protein
MMLKKLLEKKNHAKKLALESKESENVLLRPSKKRKS